MSDQDATVDAEALIMTIARAMYEDTAVALIDVLIRDKFLRDDQDMGTRLSLPPKQIRKTLQFLQEEHLVKSESVDDLAEGGSQATKFWYIDYNHAVNVIRLRVFLLRKKLEDEELRARSSSMYHCPGYKTKVCNGRYTEIEAQQVVDPHTGLFLCQECYTAHMKNPNPPPVESYTLQLLDNTQQLKQVMDNMRRVSVQLSGKMIGNHQLRAGIYDLIQKVRIKGAGPLTSNLPSENRQMNIGSKRLAGTGRTAGVKLKKLKEQMGMNENAHSIDLKGNVVKHYLSGTTGSDDLTFLKNALGQQIAFELEKGAGARAYLLATKSISQRRLKLLDEAAIRVGVEFDLVSKLAIMHKRKRQQDKEGDEQQAKMKKQSQTLAFLRNNIGRLREDDPLFGMKRKATDEDKSDESDDDMIGIIYDSDDEFASLPEKKRRTIFQADYKKEMMRQKSLLGITSQKVLSDDTSDVLWEDG